MSETFQITGNEVISAICKSIHEGYGDTLNIYKENQSQQLDLPAVTVYCSAYEKITERFDRFTNNFDIIINYFPEDTYIINNNGRQNMFANAEKIAHFVDYIKLPAYKKVNSSLQLFQLPCRHQSCNISEKDGFIQIALRYVVRTKVYDPNAVKMGDLKTYINKNC